jgi:nucleoid-associated protein YgaU
MSVMSAAKARQVAGVGPDVPSPRLQIARSAGRPAGADSGRGAAAEAPPGAGSERPADGRVTRSQAALRVRHVRVVRQVSIRSRRAGVSRSVPPVRFVRAEQAGGAVRFVRAEQAGGAARFVRAEQAGGTARIVRPEQVTGPAGPVRLTRRGRLVVAGLAALVIAAAVIVLVIAAAGSVQASSHATAPGSAYRGMTQVVVRPGQTLWSIAAAAEPSGNAWAVVQQIINANALTSVEVQAGQLLWVPRG